jgi:hypothetical protein
LPKLARGPRELESVDVPYLAAVTVDVGLPSIHGLQFPLLPLMVEIFRASCLQFFVLLGELTPFSSEAYDLVL